MPENGRWDLIRRLKVNPYAVAYVRPPQDPQGPGGGGRLNLQNTNICCGEFRLRAALVERSLVFYILVKRWEKNS